jgi:hypothetical protein
MRETVERNRGKLVAGVASGAVATLLMTALLFAAPVFTGIRLPEVAARAWATLAAHPLWVVAAFALHLGYGALAGALYATGTRRVSVTSGLFYGFALWGVAVAVYAPLMGLGFVVSHDPALAVLILPAHLLYGVTLGALAPKGEIVQPIADAWPFGLDAA